MTTKSLRIVLVGCGVMGSAMARGWLVANLDFKLTIVTPNRHNIRELPGAKNILWYPSYQTVPLDQEPDVIVLALKPDILEHVLPTIPQSHLDSAVVISIAAGKNLAFYYKYLPESTALVKIMPNLPVAFHAGMSVGIYSSACCPEQIRLVEELFKALGQFIWVEDEELFHAVTVISGCGPAYVYLMEEAMIKAGELIGLSTNDASVLARQTIVGATKILACEDVSATNLKERVTSPGGVTAATRAILEQPDIGLPDLFIKAFQAGINRSHEIAGG